MMRVLLAALAMWAVLAAGPALAAERVPGQPEPQLGEKLVQCVVFKYEVPGDKARVLAEVIVFARTVATAELDPENTTLEFAFEDGFVKAEGRLSATFQPFDGTGELLLDTLTYACDFSGEYTIEDRKVTDLHYLARFNY